MVLLQIDAKNAFNSMERNAILQEAVSILRVPPVSCTTYTEMPPSYFGNNLIRSSTGTQQGDPLGMLLFSLALHPVILKVSGKIIQNYSERVVCRCRYPHCSKINCKRRLSLIKSEGEKVGFCLNVTKDECMVAVPEPNQQWHYFMQHGIFICYIDTWIASWRC